MNLDWFHLEQLINRSSYSDSMKAKLETRLIQLEDQDNEFAELEYFTIIEKLKDNQLCPIEHGMNYGQKDIIRKLKKD